MQVTREHSGILIRTPVPPLSDPEFDLFSKFEVLHHFQHCTGHIMMGSLVGRGHQFIHLVKILY